ncbi:response regulator [Paenibacillus macquariensis]|uniref:Two component transcriptional regulator, AraC family n=1 Tax=Paenibacillus macquariensis TaxID=948756 RepID=A0ABY1K5S4_9BACL|nr:response regulator [Paenibacillus macquariensis]MEC0090458.1 response regulator [Paenibacillus macquariensis]OAB35194.1 DNA-binding response regulator [Paenibacillus macquariensis subsp. macquariensis]SIR29447.1 two component transcriptional regulator, AraC family [Paenibacillus macquariensis]
MKTILIVDDEPRTRQGIRRTLETWGLGTLQLETFASAKEALVWLEEHEANLMITDIRMPEINGLELIEQLHHQYPSLFLIVISGFSEFEYARTALKFGVIDYLLKPIDKAKLIQAVELGLQKDEHVHRMKRMEKIVDTRLMEAHHEEGQGYNTTIRDAISYLEEHLAEPIAMHEIATRLHMNASYFSVLFKEQIGLTFSEYLTRRRVQRAKELLVNTSLSINEISEHVGYQTAKYFVKVFRSFESLTPGQYRQSMNENNTQY